VKKCLSCEKPFESEKWVCPICGFVPPTPGPFRLFAPELSKENEGFHVEDFDILSRLEKGHFWFESRNRLLSWALRKYFPNARTFLEIGCGTGYVLSWIEKTNSHLRLSGSEIYESALHHAQKNVQNTELFQMDARRIPYQDEFDLIGIFDVLEHIQEDEKVLSQMNQAVRKGGGILITVPQHKFLWSDADKFGLHVRRYEYQEMKNKVEKAGFKVIRSTSFLSFLLPFMLASRFMSGRKIEAKGAKMELEINPALNRIFGWITNLERLFIMAGVRFPLGGSLLLIAQKPE
jgi:SAM-dependent methyltransferase